MVALPRMVPSREAVESLTAHYNFSYMLHCDQTALPSPTEKEKQDSTSSQYKKRAFQLQWHCKKTRRFCYTTI